MSFENTQNINQYVAYRQYVESHHFFYKGIDLVSPMVIDVAGFYLENDSRKWRTIIDLLTRQFQPAPLFEAFNKYKTVMTFEMLKRKDHEQLMRMLTSSIDDSTLVLLPLSRSWLINPLRLLKCLVFFKREKQFSLRQRLFLAAKMYWFSNLIYQLDAVFKDISLVGKNYIPFCAHESLLSYYFKQKGATTFAIQHGMFGHYKFFIPRDVVNGDLMHVDKILTISQYQKDDLIRDWNIPEEKIYVAGNIKYASPHPMRHTPIKKCLILGGIASYDKYLMELLQLLDVCAEKTGMKFELRPHPFSRILSYKEVSELHHIGIADTKKIITEVFSTNDYEAVIAMNTFSYYEALYFGLYTFRYANGENVVFAGMDDHFTSIEEFITLKQKYEKESTLFEDQREKVLRFEMGVGINQYNQLVNEHSVCYQ